MPTDSNQFHLFGPLKPATEAERPPALGPAEGPDPTALDDAALVAALEAAAARDAERLASEAGRRRLQAAVLPLRSLCASFALWQEHPAQEAAVVALADVGGPDAAEAIAWLLCRHRVTGRGRVAALASAVRLRARLPKEILAELLQDDDPAVRAAACRSLTGRPVCLDILGDLLDDLNPEVSIAAACALGRFGRREAQAALQKRLEEAPTTEIIEAIATVAGPSAVPLLAKTANGHPGLREAVIEALNGMDGPAAARLADRLATPGAIETTGRLGS